MNYLMIQPKPGNPPGNPGEPDPRSQPVPLEGLWILIAMGIVLAIYYIFKKRKINSDGIEL